MFSGKSLMLKLFDLKMTQGELARRCGCSQASISSYISGVRSPSLGICAKMAQELGCTVDELMHDPAEVSG